MARQPVVVSVEDADRPFAEVVAGLRAAGMAVEQELEPIGTVTGSAAATALPGLAAVPGVRSVEPDRSHRVPPPDSDVQ